MRRVVVYPGRITVETADIPAPRPNEVLVRTLAAGVCGSDLHEAHGRHPFVPLPYRPGHEVVGVIESPGSAVEVFAPGQRVIVEPDLPCWTCKMCISGRENLCENLQFFGCGHPQGGMADYFTLAANRLHPVPDVLDDHSAAIIEPLSTPVHAVRLAGDVAGRTVAVLGAGTIGLFTLAVLRAHGAGPVPGIVIYGTHGAERWQAGELRTPPIPAGLDELRQSLPRLLTSIVPDRRLWIEDKVLSLVIHARLTAEPERVLEMLRAPVDKAAAAAGLGVRPGKEVLEICIPGIDKGTAIRELLIDDPAAAFYAGDDVGDLPAMAEVKAWAGRSGRPALTVGVSPLGRGPIAEQADVTVPDPGSLLSLLRQIIAAAG